MAVLLIFPERTHRNPKNRWVRSSLYSGCEFVFLLGKYQEFSFDFEDGTLKNRFFWCLQIEPLVILCKCSLVADSFSKFENEKPTRTKDTADCFFAKIITNLLFWFPRRYIILGKNNRLCLRFWSVFPCQHREGLSNEWQVVRFDRHQKNSIFKVPPWKSRDQICNYLWTVVTLALVDVSCHLDGHLC